MKIRCERSAGLPWHGEAQRRRGLGHGVSGLECGEQALVHRRHAAEIGDGFGFDRPPDPRRVEALLDPQARAAVEGR